MVNVPVNAENQPVSIRASSEVADAARQAGAHNAAERPPGGPAERNQIAPRLKAVLQAARYHGVELDPNEFRTASSVPTATDLSEWAQNAGMWARALRIRWSHLLRFQDTGPVVLLFSDGGAALLTGASAERNVVFLKSADAPDDGEATAIDELRLSRGMRLSPFTGSPSWCG
jgi:ATP-binding cassette subfamily B protein